VLLGNTWRLPLLCTWPKGSIVIEVASLTDQRKVDACPRSIEDGSAVNCATTGAFEVSVVVVVVVVLVGAGGGGALAIGTFFLHPSANAIRKTLINTVALFVLLNL
jgi:hypothetical protein